MSEPQDPDEHLAVGRPSRFAGGVPAVVQSARYALDNLGAVRGARTLLALNQTDGFDCPGCAWPDPPAGDRSHAEFCENGAKAASEENTRTLISREFWRERSIADLLTESDHWMAAQGRLAEPMVRRAGATHYEPISWDDAFAMIGDRMQALASPDEAVFYTSGRTANETAFLYQLFARQFGTNNLPDCSNMCHESSGIALSEAIGIGKGTATLQDLETAGVVIDIGHNPGTCHPRMLSALQVTRRNGGQIIAINPLDEVGLSRFQHPQQIGQVLTGRSTPIASLHLPVRINGDVAVLKGIMRAMLDAEDAVPGTVFDAKFIAQYTTGFGSFISALRAERWEVILAECGLTREQIAEAARIVMTSDRLVIAWAMGLTQSPTAVSAIQECVNLLLLRGAIGRPGCGALPVRGHSNVQGDRTMGIWETAKPEFMDALARVFHFDPPREDGYDTVAAIHAMRAGRVGVFVAMGGNFLQAAPDTERVAEGLARCGLTVHVAIKLNRSHLVTGRESLILPTIGRAERDAGPAGEQFVTVENSMGIVSMSRGRLAPASPDLMSEPRIVARMATASLGVRSTVAWGSLADDYDRVRDLIEQTIPGFDSFNQRVREPGGFALPNAPRDSRTFDTPSGRAAFTVHAIPRSRLADDQLVLMSIRSHDQFNTTVYGLDDRYRGIRGGRRVILLNRADIASRGLVAGALVDVVSHFEGEERVAPSIVVVEYEIPPRCAAMYFPEANVLVPLGSVAARSNTPTSKFVIVTIRKH